MKRPLLSAASIVALACALGGCSHAAPTQAAAAAARAPRPHGASDAAANVADAVRPGRIATDAVGATEVDTGCRTDADCAVKDVGNCCGAYPACVNANSPTFPDRVKRECEARGLSSICGYREIATCACVAGQCTAADAAGALQ